MRKFLLAATVLAPFVVAPAFAGGPQGGTAAANLSGAVSLSAGGVMATQGTAASATTAGNGSSFQAAIAGNTATVDTSGSATALPGYAATSSTTTETQGGGTAVISNSKDGRGFGNKATGTASGNQSSTVIGGSIAAAGNINGAVAVMPTGHGR